MVLNRPSGGEVMEPGKLIGSKIKRAREADGLSQPELGERLGEILAKPWSRQAVFLAERGERSFGAEELFALAFALDRPVYYFLIPDHEDGFELDLPKRRLEGSDLENLIFGAPRWKREPYPEERERNWQVWAGIMQRAADRISEEVERAQASLQSIETASNLARSFARLGPLLGDYDRDELMAAIDEAEATRKEET
jgi:transcriptional regulator with XRE-family HTH domain